MRQSNWAHNESKHFMHNLDAGTNSQSYMKYMDEEDVNAGNLQNGHNKNNEQNQDIDVKKESDKKKPSNTTSPDARKMFYGTKYEVKCDETFAYYEGYVIDLIEPENKLKIMYSWKSPQNVPINYVRPIPDAPHKYWSPKKNEHVECKAKAEESEPYGWWDCKISTVRGDLYLITYEGWEDHHEVLTLDMLRPYNKCKAFSSEGIGKSEHVLNGIVEENWVKNPANHEKFVKIREKTGLIHFGYVPDKNSILMIGKAQERENALKLYTFLLSLEERFSKIISANKVKEKSLMQEYERLKNCYKLTFKFDRALTRYIIGKKGENVQNAKDILDLDGKRVIEHVNIIPEKGECFILARDKTYAEEAKEVLDIRLATITVPRARLKEIIGVRGRNVNQITKSTHAFLISTMEHYLTTIRDDFRQDEQYMKGLYDMDESNDENVTMVIIAHQENIEVIKHTIRDELKSQDLRSSYIERKKMANTAAATDDAIIEEGNYSNAPISKRRIENSAGNVMSGYNYAKNSGRKFHHHHHHHHSGGVSLDDNKNNRNDENNQSADFNENSASNQKQNQKQASWADLDAHGLNDDEQPFEENYAYGNEGESGYGYDDQAAYQESGSNNRGRGGSSYFYGESANYGSGYRGSRSRARGGRANRGGARNNSRASRTTYYYRKKTTNKA